MKYLYRVLLDAAIEAVYTDPHCISFTPRQRRSLRWLMLYSREPAVERLIKEDCG
jgi:hypothetical protein